MFVELEIGALHCVLVPVLDVVEEIPPNSDNSDNIIVTSNTGVARILC